MKKNLKNFALAVVLSTTAFVACNKDTANNEAQTSIDNGLADNYFNDMYAVVNNAAADNGFAGFMSDNSANKTASSSCPEVIFSEPLGTFPNTMTIDFGDGCISYFGIERKGKIISTFTGPYKDAGTIITITTEDYYVNGVQVEGIKTITNLGLNDADNMHFSIVVTDAKITLLSGADITWNSERDREWVEGISTPEITDDVYSITGSATGINRDDIPFTMLIIEALRKEMDCNWIVSGVCEITPDGEETRTINYGDGECDNEATLTVGGFTTTIELPF
ncbi:MAG: hypothetical protein H7Y00_05065 [Fimbriimonadaceae bacterium]|nr:hypothetical protein [Chitinophagales bacterium]